MIINAQDRTTALGIKNNAQAMANLEKYMTDFGKGLVSRDNEKMRIYHIICAINRGE